MVTAALDAWRQCRADYNEHLWSAYMSAEEGTGGALLNARGQAKGIDPVSLFMGNRARAYAYASEELRDHWEEHPRVTYQEYERQWAEAHRMDAA